MSLDLRVRSIVWIPLWPLLWFPCFAQDGGTPAKAVEVPEMVMAKRLSHIVSPEMPKGAIGKCSNALVVLKITVNENGTVADEEFVSGFSELKESAMAAIKRWTYKPYEQGGKIIVVRTQVSIFYLGDGESFPVYSPDGKGGVKGRNVIPLPPGCGSGPTISIKKSPD
jgi:TonB family protein